MVYHSPGNPKTPLVKGATSKFGSQIKPPSRITTLRIGPLGQSFHAAGPRTVDETYMYEWLEHYQLQHYFVKVRQKIRCDFVQICSYVKPFAYFNRLDCDCGDSAERATDRSRQDDRALIYMTSSTFILLRKHA